jgi:hypothetical protein
MVRTEGCAHKREGRPVIGPRDPRIENWLGGFQIDLAPNDIEDVRRWGNAALRSRDAWADSNRSGRRYSDRETPLRTGNALARSSSAIRTKGGARD